MSHKKKPATPAKRRQSTAGHRKTEADAASVLFSQADAVEMFHYLRRVSAMIDGEVACTQSNKIFRGNVIRIMNEIDDFVHKLHGRAHANHDMNQR